MMFYHPSQIARRVARAHAFLLGGWLCAASAPAADPWAGRDEVLRRIVPPTFPARDFAVTDHGARGGFVEHVRVRRIAVQQVRDGLIRFDTTYRAQDLRGGTTPPQFRDFIIEDLTCGEARTFGLSIEGLPGAPIRDVVIRRATIEKARTPHRISETQNVRLEDVRINGEPVLLPAATGSVGDSSPTVRKATDP